MNTLDNIDKPMLSEALTLAAVIAATSGYEQDDKVRLPLLAKLARDNHLEGLVDPVTGNFVDVEGEEDDEVPFEVAEKLSTAGLLPPNAKLPQAGWFDNNRVFDAANANLKQQSSGIATRHNEIGDLMQQVREIVKNLIALRDKHAASKMSSTIGEKPVLPSNAPSPIAAKITPTFASQTMAGLKESAGLADALMESFWYADESHPLSSASAIYAQNMGLLKLIEQSWMDSPAPGIKRKPVTVPDTAPAVTPKVNAMDTSKIPPPAPAPKASAFDAGKLASASSKGLGAGEKLGAKAVGKSLLSKYAAPTAAAVDAYDAYSRYKEGDYTGAAISGLAGAAAFVPVVGAPVSLGLDAWNLYRTYSGKDKPQTAPAAPETPTAAKPTTPAAPITPAAPVTPTATTPETPAAPVTPTAATPAAPDTPTAPATPNKGTAAKPKKTASPKRSPAPFDITSFQTHLNSLGANIAVDGKPGPATDAAVRQYLLHQR